MLRKKTIVVFLVLLWWIANGLTSLYSKSELPNSDDRKSFWQMKWLDLTIMQFQFGAVISMFWIFIIEKKSLNVPQFNNWSNLIVVLGNLLGHLSVNVSYSLVSSSATQVVKSSEPLFMFLFLFCMGQRNMNARIMFSIILMIFGTCIFVSWDMTFNTWGMFAAVVSNIAFPLRNIALKNNDLQDQCPSQKYFIVSFFGILVLFPFQMLKLFFKSSSPFLLTKSSIGASTCHCVYNLASISVLQNVSPLNHAILNFSKRIFVISLNIKYFDVNVTWHMMLGLVIIFVALAIYLFVNGAKVILSFSSLKPKAGRCFRFLLLIASLTLLSGSVQYFSLPRQYSDNDDGTYNRDVSKTHTTAWPLNRPMSNVFLANIVKLHKQTGASINVYCGTMKCLEVIEKVKNPRINGIFLVVPDVLGKTSLKEWAQRHALYKVLAGLHYERYLTHALCLAHLWQYGGTFFLPSYKMIQRPNHSTAVRKQSKKENYRPCIPLEDILNENKSKNYIRIPPKNQQVQQQIATFLRNMKSWNSTASPGIFQDTVWNALSRACPNAKHCPLTRNSKSLRHLYMQHEMKFEDDNHFGTLSLDRNVGDVNKANIGDEIQAIVGIQFLPFVDFFLDRELLITPATHRKHTVFFNAWWSSRSRWPPRKNIDPVMLSIHINKQFRQVISTSREKINFLKSKAPIGARDLVTKNFLAAIDVQSFLSACMTLLLRIKTKPIAKRGDTIYIVDVPRTFTSLLPEWIVKKAKYIKHGIRYGERPTLMTQERFVDAYKLLENYSQAKLVITRRIHAALPCVAMGTPVIFFNTPNMPGGGGVKANASDRVTGILDLFHTVDLYKQTRKQAKDELSKIDWTNPPKNPNLGIRMRFVSSMWYILRRNQAIYESARRFDGLPLTPRWLITEHRQNFHVILRHSQGGLKWYQWRCIESILRYHPTSRLLVHSNTIEQFTFDILTEVGYQVTLRNYNVPELIERTTLKEFFSELGKTSSDELEKMLHEHGLLRLLLLYKYGGMYLYESTIVLKAINNREKNELSLDSKSEVNSWMLSFEKNHKFLENVFEMFPRVYNPQLKPDGGKVLLTKVCNFIVCKERSQNSI